MRPVELGDVPLDDIGSSKVFGRYQDARGDLISKIGEYCSYCEMHLDASLAVEHVQPKVHKPELALKWDNFLLACTNCNSTKGSMDVELDDYYWPDRDNTALAIEYSEGGIVQANSSLSRVQKEKAERTINLTGLERIPGNNPADSDRRWNNRRETWDMAVRAKRRLKRRNYSEMREQIVEHAKSKGFWSVWMAVFREDMDMRRRFITTFPGTSEECFDAGTNEIWRAGGAI